ncbi:MAG: hypothetical protein Q4G67_10840 [Actinomycetia bacterium]|nr:hypothetical protein [Actinomycetes bacterium]
MTDFWTAQDDAILEARRVAKIASDAITWPADQSETVGIDGTTIELHNRGNHSDGVPESWGFCADVTAFPGSPWAVMRGCVGDEVRPGHEAELDRVIEAVNLRGDSDWRSLEFNSPPFRYIRDGNLVFLEARFRPDELTEDERYWLNWHFDCVMMNHTPDDDFEPHMMAVHFEDDDDCVCDDCWPLEERPDYVAPVPAPPAS